MALVRRPFVFLTFPDALLVEKMAQTTSESRLLTGSLSELAARVGNTSLIPLPTLSAELADPVSILAKAEWENPSGSVKDRPALSIIRSALRRGDLAPGKRLLDSTSGNMGIAYATICASIGVPVTLTVPASASPERLTVLQALGAEVVLTDPLEGSDGATLEARRLAHQNPGRYWYARQYDNPANVEAHFSSTGPEILQQTGASVTHLVAGVGTSGTLMGAGRYLREHKPSINVVAVQPDDAFHGLEGLKHMATALRPTIYDPAFADESIFVRTENARAMVRRLARDEGLLVGISSGAAAWAAMQLAMRLDEGIVVVIFADSGQRYLSDQALWSGA